MKKSNLDKQSVQYKDGTRLLQVLVIIGLLFLVLVAYLTYLEIFAKDDYINNSFNQRQWKQEENTLRGDIVDCDGTLLASSYTKNNVQIRDYAYDTLYTHIIGYNSKVYGKSQIELTYNKNLAGLSEASKFTDIKGVLSEERKGDTVHLTIMHALQEKAYSMLGNRAGAVVAMNPETGEVLCMASTPTFNPESSSLSNNWDKLNNRTDSPFLNRATNGLYAPGSVFKTIVLCAALENGMENFTIDDKGTVEVGGRTYKNTKTKAYGLIDLKRAYAVSSNVAFITIGQDLGEETIKQYIKKFRIGDKIKFDIPVSSSRFDYKDKLYATDLAQVSIGQGKLQVTPLQMAMMVSTIANDGVVEKPYIVKKVVNSTGITVINGKAENLGRAVSTVTARKVQEFMIETVKSGTASNAAVYGLDVGGKTGTAENERENQEHAWFVGYAEKDGEKIAVAVIIEYDGGTGGSSAAPIARELFKIWKERL